MRLLTVYVVQFLIDLEVLSVSLLDERFQKSDISLHIKKYTWLTKQDQMKSAMEFNSNLKNWNNPGQSILTHELIPYSLEDERDFARTHAKTIFESLNSSRDQIYRWLSEYCPEPNTPEGEFPYFSPESTRRTLSDGSIEQILPNTFIFTLDIIRSTDSELSSLMKDEIIATLQRFSQPHLFYEITGNDAFVVCADNPQVLWDIACAVKLRAERIRIPGDTMKGTRKGLSYGSLTTIESPNGSIRIKDAWTPHIIPQAISLLDGVDIFAAKKSLDPNSIIAIDDRYRGRIVTTSNIENLGELFLDKSMTKHYIGTCSFAALQDV